MSPGEIIGDAFGMYRAHWQHFAGVGLTVFFVVAMASGPFRGVVPSAAATPSRSGPATAWMVGRISPAPTHPTRTGTLRDGVGGVAGRAGDAPRCRR